jgi:hypothetical protein
MPGSRQKTRIRRNMPQPQNRLLPSNFVGSRNPLK